MILVRLSNLKAMGSRTLLERIMVKLHFLCAKYTGKLQCLAHGSLYVWGYGLIKLDLVNFSRGDDIGALHRHHARSGTSDFIPAEDSSLGRNAVSSRDDAQKIKRICGRNHGARHGTRMVPHFSQSRDGLRESVLLTRTTGDKKPTADLTLGLEAAVDTGQLSPGWCR